MIELFAPKATRSVMADWVELGALSASRASASWADLLRAVQLPDDADHGIDTENPSGEALEEEITGAAYESLLGDVADELRYRASTLGDNYPFLLRARSGKWSLQLRDVQSSSGSSAHLVYKTCLLISAFRHNMLRSPDYDHARQMSDCMQRVAYFVAGEVIGGEAHWFGWPRPDSTTTMRTALEALLVKLKHGAVKLDDPDWTNGHEKDAGIDVVAWRSFRDGKPGSLVLYGQVASGLDWTSKPVTGEFLKAYFNDWFVDEPTSHYMPATFIPFMQHDSCRPKKGQTYERAMHGGARRDEITHGLVIDRMRLTELAVGAEARRGESLAADSAVQQWFAASMRMASAA